MDRLKNQLTRRSFLANSVDSVAGAGLTLGLGSGLLGQACKGDDGPLSADRGGVQSEGASRVPQPTLPPLEKMGSNAHGRLDSEFFPFFSDEEFAARYEQVRAAMATKGYAALIVYGSQHYSGNDTGQANVVYLANVANIVQSYLVFPQSGEPTLFAGLDFHIPTMKKLSPIQDVQYAPDLTLGAIGRLNQLMLQSGAKVGIVAYAGASIPSNHFQAIQAGVNPVGDVMFEDATAWFEGLRWKHSAEELYHLERAGKLTSLVHGEVVAVARAGLTHTDTHRVLQVQTALEGGTYALSHMSSTPMADPAVHYPDLYSTEQEIQEGDVFMTEIAVGYGNYTTKLCSTFFVGQPTDDYKRLFDLAVGLLHAAEDGLKPGMTGADVSKYFADAITGDYTYYQPLVMGWSTYLHPPYLGGLPGNPAYDFFARPFDAFALEEGHTFTIIPWVGLKNTKKAVWLGTTYKMTATGVEALTNFAVDELRIV